MRNWRRFRRLLPLLLGLGLVLLPVAALAQEQLFSVTDLSSYPGEDATDVGDWLGSFAYVDGTGSYWCTSVGGYGPQHTILLDEETTILITFESYKGSALAGPARLEWQEWNGADWDTLESVEADDVEGVWTPSELQVTYDAGLYRAAFTINDESCDGRIRSTSATTDPGSSVIPTLGGLPFLTGGTPGGYCYDCNAPGGFDLVGWLAYLACMIVNVASCHIWSWLMAIVNVGIGQVNLFISFINWMLASSQNVLNFFASSLVAAVGWVLSLWTLFVDGLAGLLMGIVNSVINSDFIQSIWSRYYYLAAALEVARILGQMLLTMIQNFLTAVAFIINLIFDFVNILINATDAEPIDLNEIMGYEGDGYGEITDPGWNIAKVIVFTLWGLGAFDNMMASSGLQYIQYPLLAVLTLGVVLWTIRQFHVFAPAS